MGMGGCYNCMKYMVFLINLIFWVSGIALIGVSIWLFMDPFYLGVTQDEYNYTVSVILLLSVGVLLFIVGFLGCCGVVRSSKALLVLFFCFLLLMMVAEISATIWAYSNLDKLDVLVRESVQTTVEKEYGSDDTRTKTVDIMQRELECCGARGWSDWISNKHVNKDNLLDMTSESKLYKIPISCCREEVPGTLCNGIIPNNEIVNLGNSPQFDIYKQGCSDKILGSLYSYNTWIIIVGSILLLIQLCGLIFSLVICCSIPKKPRYSAIHGRNKL